MLKRISNALLNSSSRFTFVISFCLIAFYLYQDLVQWPLIKFINAQGPIIYVDSNTVLYYARCYSEIGNYVFASGVECSNWNYGSTILIFLNLINITGNFAGILGHFFTYSILGTFVYFIYLTRNLRSVQFVLFLGLMSPSVWLLMERANFDALIYLMLFLAALLFAKGFETIPIMIILASATFKFYTLPLLVIFIYLSKKIHNKVFGLCALVFGTIIVFNDYVLMGGMSMQAGNNHFGMKIIGNYLGKIGINLENIHAYLVGIILFIITITCVIYVLIKFNRLIIANRIWNNQEKNFFIYMSATFLICFIVGLSVDYRLIFYLVSAPLLISVLESRLRLFVSLCYLIGAYFCYPFGVFQTVGDFALEIMAAFQLILLFFHIFPKKTFIKMKVFRVIE
jgi:hypothetical protein